MQVLEVFKFLFSSLYLFLVGFLFFSFTFLSFFQKINWFICGRFIVSFLVILEASEKYLLLKQSNLLGFG